MKAAYNGHTAVVELLLSKGANIEAADKVMNPYCWLKFLISYFLDFDDYRDKIITIFMNIQIIRSAEMEQLLRLLLVLLFSRKIMQIGCLAKVPMTTDGRMHEYIVILFLCVRPSVWSCSSLLPSYASSINLFQHLFLHYRYSYISDIIFKNLIIVWECQNSRFSESAVSWTLHFTPKDILWYLRVA